MNKWQEFQDEMFEWASNTFNETHQSILLHLKEEVEELQENPTDPHEYADCIMLLIESAALAGYSMDDLLRFCKEKLEICKNRKWAEPDENGVIQHINES